MCAEIEKGLFTLIPGRASRHISAYDQ
jgi:hypothetical protein